jgi:hypothetical protein
VALWGHTARGLVVVGGHGAGVGSAPRGPGRSIRAPDPVEGLFSEVRPAPVQHLRAYPRLGSASSGYHPGFLVDTEWIGSRARRHSVESLFTGVRGRGQRVEKVVGGPVGAQEIPKTRPKRYNSDVFRP